MAEPFLYSRDAYSHFYGSKALLRWAADCPSGEFGHRAWRLLYPAHRSVVTFIDSFSRDTSVLDLGCGPGWLLRVLKARGFLNVRGLEIVASVAAIVQSKGIPVVVGDVTKLRCY